MSNFVSAPFGYSTLTLIMCAPPFVEEAYHSECAHHRLPSTAFSTMDRREQGAAAMNRMMLTIVAVALVAVPSFAQDTTIKDQLFGTWKVVTLKATSEGKVTQPLGDQVAGYVSITPSRIWLLFVDSTRKPPAAPSLTDAEAVAMMKSHVAWTGNYSTGVQTSEGIKLTARVDAASSQALTGTDRVYFMRVEGDRLTMKSPGVIVPMTGKTSVVEIELVKAD